jgi:hypothetical protein
MHIEIGEISQDRVYFFDHPHFLFFLRFRLLLADGDEIRDFHADNKESLVGITSLDVLFHDLVVDEVSFQVEDEVLFAHLATGLELHRGPEVLIVSYCLSYGLCTQRE